jgi:general secretion pathway protein N
MNVRAARLTTKALAGICGGLLLVVIAQYAGFGRGYRWAADVEGDVGKPTFGAIDNKPVNLPPESTFAEIEARPLFNEDRKPSPLDAAGGEAGPPPSPLNIALTGVILDDANHVRIAMLQDKTRNQAIALKVGMPLEGEQASWTLVEVKPRGAVFRSAANETSEVELETSVVQPPNRPAARPANPPAGSPPAGAPPSDKGQDSSADLAHRIEERRKQMREDAERLRNGGKDKPAPPKK